MPDASAPTYQRCGSCKVEKPLDDYSPSYRGKVGTWCRPCFAAYNSRDRKRPEAAHEPRVCSWCGAQYSPRQLKAAAAYCSRICKSRGKNAAIKAATLASKPTDRRCAWCGSVMPPAMKITAAYCSADCNSAAHRTHRNWARRMGSRAPVKPRLEPLPSFIDIAERDRWTCALCAQPVDPALRFPDLMRGSLDHIVPLAKGGTNDDTNLQLSHLLCNLRKGAAAA